jgi:hypothetical protein
MAALVIVVEPARRADGKRAPGLFTATLEGETHPLVSSRAPFLAGARALLKRGFPASAKLIMRWRGADHDSLAAPLGYAASLAVEERNHGTPSLCFAPYAELPGALRTKAHAAADVPFSDVES